MAPESDVTGRATGETPPAKATPLIALAGLAIVMAIAWILWSGLYKPHLLGLGAISCLLCVYLANRMGFFKGPSILPLLPRLPLYWAWLLKEIAKSSLGVAKIVLSPSINCSPTVIDFESEPKSEMAQVILGNSITLTPGTLTLDIHKGRLVVHCLTQEAAVELKRGEMNRRVAALETR